MTQKTNSFGELLSRCRRNSTDPVRGGPLTQERLAELLENTTGIKYSSVTISNWERDDSQIHKDDRPLLVGLLKVLHMCGGVKTRESARPTASGRKLSPPERSRTNTNRHAPLF